MRIRLAGSGREMAEAGQAGGVKFGAADSEVQQEHWPMFMRKSQVSRLPRDTNPWSHHAEG